MRVVKAGPDRPLGNAKRLSELNRLQPDVVMEDEDGPLLGGQPTKAPFELIALRDWDRLVRVVRSINGKGTDAGLPASGSARFGVAEADQQLTHPTLEPIDIAEGRQFAPRDHQSLLHDILGATVVTDDAKGDREEPIGVRIREEAECVPVAMLGQRDELSIHAR
jgi:hypothetical protein